VRCTQRLTLDPKQVQQAVELRQQPLHLRHIARLLKVHFSTVVWALSQLGLGRLMNLGPAKDECRATKFKNIFIEPWVGMESNCPILICHGIFNRDAEQAPRVDRPGHPSLRSELLACHSGAAMAHSVN